MIRGHGMKEVEAKVIARQNGLTLVEWQSGNEPNRAWVTPDMIVSESGRSATIRHPEGGIPYGVDWAALVNTQVDADEIARRLKQAGLWTVEDLQRKTNAARGVINAVAGDILQNLLTNARSVQRDARN